MINSVTIVGYGSVGKYHANSARTLGVEEIFVIDPFEKPKAEALENGFKTFDNLQDFSREVNCIDSHVVISNWGPDHCKTLFHLFDKNVTSFTVEKPFCTSIHEGLEVLDLIQKNNAFLNVHFRWSYLELHERLNKISHDFDLGDPTEIICLGGAHCLSTGGTHWIDFARKLFKNEIKSVSSDCDSESINPRSQSLMYLGGYLCCTFDNDQKLLLNFSNRSSLPLSVNINYRNAQIEISLPNKINLYMRDPSEIERFSDKITRYGPLRLEKTFELGAKDTTRLVLQEAQENVTTPKASAKDGFIASSVIMAALESAKMKSTQILLDDFVNSRPKTEWSFS